MAHIEDRWYKTVAVDGRPTQVPKPGCGKGMRYRVRYIAPDGREKSESFPDRRKREAQAFLARVQADIHNGTYVDPDAGRVTFREYATQWLASVGGDLNTRDRLAREFRLHVFPAFGDEPLGAVLPATLRAWTRQLADRGLSPGFRRNVFGSVSAAFAAAVDDRLIPGNPATAKTVRAPRYVPGRVVPWPVDRLAQIRAHLPERYRVAVDLGAGCGLRQGEVFGVSPDDIERDRPVLHVVRQVKVIREHLVFAPPKGGKTREVPLPESVAVRLRAHAETYPSTPVTLPWTGLDGPPQTVPLYLTTTYDNAVFRTRFNDRVWKPALRAAGVEVGRRNGMHVLRHT